MNELEVTDAIMKLAVHLSEDSEPEDVRTFAACIGEEMTGSNDGRMGVIVMAIGPREELINTLLTRSVGSLLLEEDGDETLSSFNVRAT